MLQLLWSLHAMEFVAKLQVEIKSTPDTPDIGSLQKAADFINAFILGECQGSI